MQEAAILCVGYMKTSCYSKLKQNLRPLMEQMFEGAKCGQYLIRGTSIWAISQFTEWIGEVGESEPGFVKSYIGLLIASIEDEQKNVQESSFTALNKLAYEQPQVVVHYLNEILAVYLKIIDAYTDEVLLEYCFQAIQAIVEAAGQQVRNKHYSDVIFAKLINKFPSYQPNDQKITALYECIATCIDVFDHLSHQYLPTVFQQLWKSVVLYMEDL